MVFNDPYSARMMLEIMASFKVVGVFQFMKDRFSLTHCNSDNSALASFTVHEDGLLYYQRQIRGDHDEDMPVYAMVNMVRFIETWKSLAKKDSLNVWAEIMNGIGGPRIDTINCQNRNEGVDRVICDGGDVDDKRLADMMDTYYRGAKPNVKVGNSKFATLFNKFKTRKFTSVQFILRKKEIIIRGYKDKILLTVTRWCDGIDDDDDDDDDDDCRVEDIENNYSITIDYSFLNSWMTKICKLSPNTSVIKLYLAENAPLIIVSNVGSMGYGYFALADKTKQK
jgi:hypothetical protein